MVISDRFKFIFIHIPKTGGTSCQSALTSCLSFRDRYHWANNRKTKHETIKLLKERNKSRLINHLHRKIFRNDIEYIIDDYYKFAFVRNPWDRTVSLYHYLVKQNKIIPNKRSINNFKDFVLLFSKDVAWLEELYSMKNQYDYLADNNGKLTVDFVGKFENLEEDFEKITRKLGLEVSLPHLNKVKHKSYIEYYDDESYEIVKNRFRKDIAAFNYKFNE